MSSVQLIATLNERACDVQAQSEKTIVVRQMLSHDGCGTKLTIIDVPNKSVLYTTPERGDWEARVAPDGAAFVVMGVAGADQTVHGHLVERVNRVNQAVLVRHGETTQLGDTRDATFVDNKPVLCRGEGIEFADGNVLPVGNSAWCLRRTYTGNDTVIEDAGKSALQAVNLATQASLPLPAGATRFEISTFMGAVWLRESKLLVWSDVSTVSLPEKGTRGSLRADGEVFAFVGETAVHVLGRDGSAQTLPIIGKDGVLSFSADGSSLFYVAAGTVYAAEAGQWKALSALGDQAMSVLADEGPSRIIYAVKRSIVEGAIVQMVDGARTLIASGLTRSQIEDWDGASLFFANETAVAYKFYTTLWYVPRGFNPSRQTAQLEDVEAIVGWNKDKLYVLQRGRIIELAATTTNLTPDLQVKTANVMGHPFEYVDYPANLGASWQPQPANPPFTKIFATSDRNIYSLSL